MSVSMGPRIVTRRIGKFSLPVEILEEWGPMAVAHLFENMVVVRCEQRYEMDSFEYIALSPKFDEVEVGMFAPTYILRKELFVAEDGEPAIHLGLSRA